ncbi:hypothetical protein DTL42_11095 [Bremerella cremea]|uniref:Uncharacterized protein n=1 Tax=Bremerella cremea TaxID=1031537 RepID=A0A368KUB4_9BACT|nr:hypothetical protein [Bremerella cremea]RCS50641.1 hypothetical protein DTL42_11095 [Bremerella cremea]
MDGPLITAWTIRIALLLLLACLLLRMTRPWWSVSEATLRGVWTAGCLVFLAHIAAGMHFYHQWDHRHAYEETAQQTYDTLGIRFGGGIYVNHLMAIVWTGDVLWWWLAPQVYRQRRPLWGQMIVGFFLFIAFNGLVVFKEGSLRLAGLVGFGVLTLAWLVVQVRGKPDVSHVETIDH